MRFTLENKIRAGFGFAFLVLLLVSAVSYRSMAGLISASSWVTHTHEVLAELESTLSAIEGAEASQRNYLITGDKDYVAQFETEVAGASAHLQRVRFLTRDNPDQQRRIDHLKPLIDERIAILQEGLNLRISQNFEAAKQQVQTGQGKSKMDEIRSALADMEHEEGGLLVTRVKEDEASVRTTLWTIGIFILLTSVFLGMGTYLIERDFAGRRRAEATLLAQTALLERAQIAIMVRKFDGVITFWNRGAEQLYGWTKEEAVGKKSHDILQTQFPKPLPEIEGDIQREGFWDGELIHLARDRRLVVVASRWAVQKDEKGNPIILEINSDISELKRTEQSLAHLAAIVDSSEDAIISKTIEGEIVSWNRGAERMYGYTAAEVCGKSVSILLPPDHKDELPSILERLKHQESIDQFESVRMKKDGTMIDVSLTISPMVERNGRVVGASTIARDISARKRAEEALRASEQRLSVALESAQTGIWELDLMTDASIRSLRHDQIFGYSHIQPKWGFEIFMPRVVPEDRVQVQESFDEALKTDRLNMECRIIRADDKSVRWISAQGRVVKNEERRPVRMYGVVADITERKKVEGELQALNSDLQKRTAELTAANKELEAFTYSVSHDLRAPLRHIDGFSKLLVEDHLAELTEEAREYISLIRDSTREMGQLVDDLLNLARVGRKELAMEVTGLSSLVDEVVADLKRANPGRAIQWRLEALPFVECDPGLLKQVFANLLSNAVKFTRKRESAVIEVGEDRQNGERVVFVRDNGVGFSMKSATKLFGVFQRLHRQEDFEGTGVGLATVQRIIYKHGGHVWAEAELNQGATFFFALGPSGKPDSKNDPAKGVQP
ncbi:MAG TPA: PAS domain S-box protein [Terriglobia bacterium]|nr:PAS domain S-box protein [Terriglobia bacterium]